MKRAVEQQLPESRYKSLRSGQGDGAAALPSATVVSTTSLPQLRTPIPGQASFPRVENELPLPTLTAMPCLMDYGPPRFPEEMTHLVCNDLHTRDLHALACVSKNWGENTSALRLFANECDQLGTAIKTYRSESDETLTVLTGFWSSLNALKSRLDSFPVKENATQHSRLLALLRKLTACSTRAATPAPPRFSAVNTLPLLSAMHSARKIDESGICVCAMEILTSNNQRADEFLLALVTALSRPGLARLLTTLKWGSFDINNWHAKHFCALWQEWLVAPPGQPFPVSEDWPGYLAQAMLDTMPDLRVGDKLCLPDSDLLPFLWNLSRDRGDALDFKARFLERLLRQILNPGDLTQEQIASQLEFILDRLPDFSPETKARLLYLMQVCCVSRYPDFQRRLQVLDLGFSGTQAGAQDVFRMSVLAESLKRLVQNVWHVVELIRLLGAFSKPQQCEVLLHLKRDFFFTEPIHNEGISAIQTLRRLFRGFPDEQYARLFEVIGKLYAGLADVSFRIVLLFKIEKFDADLNRFTPENRQLALTGLAKAVKYFPLDVMNEFTEHFFEQVSTLPAGLRLAPMASFLKARAKRAHDTDQHLMTQLIQLKGSLPRTDAAAIQLSLQHIADAHLALAQAYRSADLERIFFDEPKS